MGLVSAGLFVLLLCFSAHIFAGYGLSVENPDLEWERMAQVVDEEMTAAPEPRAKSQKGMSTSGSSTPKAKRVPEFQIVRASADVSKYLKPEEGYRKLPDDVRKVLLVTAPPKSTRKPAPKKKPPVEVLCHVDRLYVRVLRRLFHFRDDYKYLKLGKCAVNAGTKEHYYFLYLLKSDCGFKSQSLPDVWAVSIVLSYERPKQKFIMRQVNFKIPLTCQYYRFFHSYKVGFFPKVQGGTLFKALSPKTGFVLTSQDASGSQLAGGKTYILGEPMYFSASQRDAGNADKRLYIHKCVVTASKNPNSSPKFTLIDHYGCMLDSKLSPNSKFLACKSKLVQKFMVGAFVFKNKYSSSSRSQHLYLHCNMALGSVTPTKTQKACTFDPVSKKWKELYGPDSVCTCCEKQSTCSSSKPRATTDMVSSSSWNVNVSDNEEAEEIVENEETDEAEELVPQLKSSDTEMIAFEEPGVAMEDFLNWEEEDY